MQRKIKLGIIVSLIILISILILKITKEKQILNNDIEKQKLNFISMMVENEEGKYEERTDINFPKENSASPNNWHKKPYNGETTYIPGDETDYRSATDENWIYMGLNEMTITQLIGNNGVFSINNFGEVFPGYAGNYAIAVRPCFYLLSNTKLKEGNGSKILPYRLSFN